MEIINNQILETAINGVRDRIGISVCDLHNGIFNEDYFIVGRYHAERFLSETQEGIFGAISMVKEYQEMNFGECDIDFSEAEHVANMYAYIKGEELLISLNSYTENMDEELTDELAEKIINELENI